MPRKLLALDKPPKPVSAMTDAELRAWTRELAEKMCTAR
jgi:hypothetical protein